VRSAGIRFLLMAVPAVMASIAGISMPLATCIGQEAAPRPEVFNQCAVCHSIDGGIGTGPTLKGLFGRPSGSVSGFRYSREMRGAGVVWDAKALDDYLRSPQDFIPGNVMPFSGVPDSAERAGLIAYLRSLK
jgi:cytochrome c